jgi:hypothetical protein
MVDSWGHFSGADERGTVASGRRAGILDAAGDGPAQVAGKGRPCW